MNQIFGYMRVSAKDQNEDRQIIALSEFNIPTKNLYLDKKSGKNFERPSYIKMMRRIKNDDLLIIKSIDRLGRNYNEIIEQWRIITKEKSANIKVIDMPLLDTRKSNDLTGTLIADIVLQLLSYVAQTERENIKQRQKEGIAAAHKKGVKFGRPPIKPPIQFVTIYNKWLNNEMGSRAAAQKLNVSQSTFLKWIRSFE